MEWMIPVNEMLKDEITKLNYTLIPPGCQGDVRTVRIIQESLGKLIDSLGEQSASAQGLSKAITTAEKLRNAPTHILYLLKDAAGKNGEGEIIGYLKVAYKHLYLFDERDKVCQVEPMCVLDFYVSGARQRRGNGKKLFDFMLKDTGTTPLDLAVDGPSSKMETFLAKNYGVNQLIRQSNNFAVSPAFFITTPDATKSGRSTPVIPSAAVGRFTARKPQSSISDVIHGGTDRMYVETNNGTPEEYAPEPKPPSPEPEMEPVPEPEPVPEARAPASPSLERPTTLPVAPAVSAAPSPAGSAAPRRDSQLTDQGYFDVKFYHNKLCIHSKSDRSPPVIPSAAVGRYTAPKPQSSISDVIHGATHLEPVETNNCIHSKSGRSPPVIPSAAVGRFTAHKPQSSMSDVIHGATHLEPVETNNCIHSKSGRSPPVIPSAAVGRFTAHKPQSSMSDVIHGATHLEPVETNNCIHSKSGRSPPVIPSAAVGRFTAHKPQSSMSDVIHGATHLEPVETNNCIHSKSGRSPPVIPSAAVGRFTAHKPQSSMSDVIHGATHREPVEINNGNQDNTLPIYANPQVNKGSATRL